MMISELLAARTLSNSAASRLDVELLLAAALGQPRNFLYAYPEYTLTTVQEERFNDLFERRVNGEPIAYILGKKEFWSLELTVNSSVLIPRPETEMLVEAVLNKFDDAAITIADLGTGSGAIALALAHSRPKWTIIATDISKEALSLARYNAARLQLKNIEFYCGNWCDALPNKKFDLIISNPPYVAKSDPHLQQGDVRFEPKIALEAEDGLSAFRKIIVQVKDWLKPGGIIILEHGHDQSKNVQNLLHQSAYQNIMSYQDLTSTDRMVVGVYNANSRS